VKEVEQQEVKGLEVKQEVKQEEASWRIRRALQALSPQTRSPVYVNGPLYGSLAYDAPLKILALDAAHKSGIEPTTSRKSRSR